MRPTGKLHLGNYVGALRNWVNLQDEYDCFFFIADWHALTTDYADTRVVKQNSLEVIIDYLAAGLDPERSTLFIQSHVPQHAELHLLFSMITPLGWLERVPSYKEQRENLKDKDLGTYGFLGYPLLQSADILIYQANFVPVGEDQVPHVELTREVARRFNQFYPRKTARRVMRDPQREVVFPEPQPLLTPAAKLPGTDGRKMSKSYGNTILLSEPEASLRAEAEDHGHRSGAHSAHRSRRSRQVSGWRPAQDLQRRGNDGEGLRRLPHGGHRLHRVQEVGRRTVCGGCSAPIQERRAEVRSQSQAGVGHSGSRIEESARQWPRRPWWRRAARRTCRTSTKRRQAERRAEVGSARDTAFDFAHWDANGTELFGRHTRLPQSC